MRVNEVTRLEGKKLFEALDKGNDTGVATENLVRVVEAQRKNEWQAFESADDLLAHLDGITKEQ